MRLKVKFYATESGREPVREWLRALPRQERKIIGDDIKTAQYGWPLGMPLIRKDDFMVLLHGFIKKSQKTPKKELDLARKRAAKLKGR